MTAAQMTKPRSDEIAEEIARLELDLADVRNELKSMGAARDQAQQELDRALAEGADRETREARRRDVQDLADQLVPLERRKQSLLDSIRGAQEELRSAQMEELAATVSDGRSRMSEASAAISAAIEVFNEAIVAALSEYHAAGNAANRAAERLTGMQGRKIVPAELPLHAGNYVRRSDVIRWLER